MNEIGYGVVDTNGKPVGIWPTTLTHALEVKTRYDRGVDTHKIVPVYVGAAISIVPEPILRNTHAPVRA